MTPKNFPAQANARRERALARILAAPAAAYSNHLGQPKAAIIEITQSRLNPSARDVRSKKDRSSGARFSR